MKIKHKYFLLAALIVTLLFYASGAIGLMQAQYYQKFQQYTPHNLIFSFVLLLLFQNYFNWSFFVVCFGIALSGFVIEAIGVNTGVIFGEYYYQQNLGVKIWNTPLIIGLNWLMLIICIYQWIKNISNIFIKSLIGAGIMLIYDIILEPVAIWLNMWQWQNNIIPLQNYITWFVIAFIMFLVWNYYYKNWINLFARYLIIIQLLFFLTLHFYVKFFI